MVVAVVVAVTAAPAAAGAARAGEPPAHDAWGWRCGGGWARTSRLGVGGAMVGGAVMVGVDSGCAWGGRWVCLGWALGVRGVGNGCAPWGGQWVYVGQHFQLPGVWIGPTGRPARGCLL